MKTIICREIKNYIRNPLLWLGLVLVIGSMYMLLRPYLQIQYRSLAQQMGYPEVDDTSEADIMDGYIPAPAEQRMERGYAEVKQQLIEGLGKPEEEAEDIVAYIRDSGMTILQIAEYLKQNYGFYSAEYIFEETSYYRGSSQEIKRYMDQKLGSHTYSFYFARKFADYGGLLTGFLVILLMAFLFSRETRKDTYELLHTKPIRPLAYITGKAAGGLSIIFFILLVLNLIFGMLCMMHAGKEGLPASAWDFIKVTLVYLIPNMCMIVCVYSLISLIFKTSLPAVPLLIIYMLYSNMGKQGLDGVWGYYGRPLAIIVRFPGRFFETEPPALALLNQLALSIVACLLLLSAVYLWKRRRA